MGVVDKLVILVEELADGTGAEFEVELGFGDGLVVAEGRVELVVAALL